MEEDIPQTKPMAGDMVKNSAGGYSWKVNEMDRLRRFLCMGSEGGTFYVGEKQLGLENAACINDMIDKGKGTEVVQVIKEYSTEGRAAKQNPIIFALSLCARQTKDMATKSAAYESLADICRIPTHLFSFIEYSEALGRGTGWGRAQRRGISKWYNNQGINLRHFANLVTKYKNRNGWSHKDVLRLCHIKPESDGVAAIVCYIVKGLDVSKTKFLKDDSEEAIKDTFAFIDAVELAKTCTTEENVIPLINEYNLVREHMPTTLLNSCPVWIALLHKMPMTAMIRNLGKMSSCGVFEAKENIDHVVSRLNDTSALKTARIHPFNVLVASHTYSKGKGDKGKLTWSVLQEIVNALDTAFYKSFKLVEPTNQRFCLALDVSGSMWGSRVNGCSSIDAANAAAALSMVTARTETQHEIVGFSDKLVPVPIDANMKLNEVLDVMQKIPMGGTDCSLPITWAADNYKKFDVFIVYTDSETYLGTVHPAEALRKYRQQMGIWNAKLIVCAFTSNGFTIADPEDPGMLDMAGFDSAGPEIIRNFSLGVL